MSQTAVTGETNCPNVWGQRFERLYMNDELSDVTLLVENTKIPAHKFLLIAQSDYFHAMIAGDYSEASQNEIELRNISLVAFKVVLKYFYTGRVRLAGLDTQQIINVLDLTNQYFDSNDLKLEIAHFLESILSVDNCLTIYHAAMLYSMESLEKVCEAFTNRNALSLLDHETFATAPEELVCAFLKRDTFAVEEMKIFEAARKWIENNPNADSKNIVSLIRWPLMTMEQLFGIVRRSNALEPEVLLDIIENKLKSKNLPHRFKVPVQNVASFGLGARVLRGIDPDYLLNGDKSNNSIFTWHNIGKGFILIQLNQQYNIDSVRLLLWNGLPFVYSFYIETSTDNKNWEMAVDKRNEKLTSWQQFKFEMRPVVFIKITGTYPANGCLICVHFECPSTVPFE